MPEDLPRETIDIEPSEDEKICPTRHTQKQRIGEEVTEKLEYVPASFKVWCDCVGKCADLLEPLVRRMHELIRLSPKINTDDTKIPVKNKNRKGSTYNGYLWTYIDDHFNVVFDFTPNRSRHGLIVFIGKKYIGYVQADAYSGYDELFEKTSATEVGCHAHARRKFEYAMDMCKFTARFTASAKGNIM